MRCGRASSTTSRASSRSTCIPASTPPRNTPGSPRSPVRRTRCTAWWRSSTGGGRWWWRASIGCPGVSCATPKGAFYAFPNVKRTGWKAKALASSLLEDAGVAIIGGPDFGILGEGYVRLCYANSTENIRKALDRMGDFLATRKAA